MIQRLGPMLGSNQTGAITMKIRYLAIAAVAALLLGGCASYGYRGGSGDYYYGQSAGSGYYGAPYGSVGYGTYGGFHGSIGYGYPGTYYRRSYWPSYYSYGHRYPTYAYYPPYYYGRPIVRPRPGNDRPPRESRPNAPWRNLQGVSRVEHRERPQRVDVRPVGNSARAQGQRERIRPSIPNARRPEAQTSRNSPWRAGQARQQSGQRPSQSVPRPQRSGPRPDRVRSAPAPSRQSSPPSRQRMSPPSRSGRAETGSRDSDRGRIQRR